MATVRIFEITSGKLNVLEISTSGNYAPKYIIMYYYYKLTLLSILTI
jgi:hypothetical protein